MPNMDGILLGPGPLAIAVTKPYSSSYLWKNGEYCTQNGKIYKFISTDLEETGETWTPAHWAETKLTDEIIGLGQRIDSLDPESVVGLFTDIAFEINTNQWVEDSTNGVWNYNYSNSLIKVTSGIAVYYDNSYISALSGHISVTKNTGYVTFTTNGQPQNRLTGTLRIVDSVSGVLPVSSGGTGAVTSKGARTNLNVSIKPICVDFGTVYSLPQTLTDINNPLYSDINVNMIPSKWVFGNPAACPNGLKCTTAAGAVTISLPDANSTFSGETTVYLELVDPQTSADSGTGSNDQQYTGDFVQIGAQSLTATQKAQARTNIGAANTEDVSALSEQITTNYLKVGNNTIDKCFMAGYVTGSRNYVACFFPCDTSKISSITSITADLNCYAPTSGGISGNSITATTKDKKSNGIFIEFPAPTQFTIGDQNRPATVVATNMVITCT